MNCEGSGRKLRKIRDMIQWELRLVVSEMNATRHLNGHLLRKHVAKLRWASYLVFRREHNRAMVVALHR